jgi:hypothetical protein
MARRWHGPGRPLNLHEVCEAGFAASHRRVPAIDLGILDYQGSRHYGSNVAGTARIVQWFIQLAD